MKQELTFGILGPIVIKLKDGTSIHPTGREARVLAALLLSVDRVVSSDELIEIVWAGTPPASPETALHNVIYRLRRTLDDSDTGATIEKDAHGYALRIDPMNVDVWQFDQLVSHAEELEAQQASEILAAALDLWRGEPFGSQPNGTQLLYAESERLNAARWMALEDRIACDIAAGNHRDVIPELVGLTTKAPIRETLWAYLMAALYLSDQRGRALQAYEQARQHLAGELGIEPSRPLRELQQAIVSQNDNRIGELVARNLS